MGILGTPYLATLQTIPRQKQAHLQAKRRWARVVSNHRPLACEASALPLSYGPSGPDSIGSALPLAPPMVGHFSFASP